jgi:hypothetical protein
MLGVRLVHADTSELVILVVQNRDLVRLLQHLSDRLGMVLGLLSWRFW